MAFAHWALHVRLSHPLMSGGGNFLGGFLPDEGGAEARPGPSASHEPSGAASRQEACEQQAEPSGRGIATGKREDAAPPACCEVCSSLTFDGQYWSAFGVAVCSSCKRDYKLISKVAAKVRESRCRRGQPRRGGPTPRKSTAGPCCAANLFGDGRGPEEAGER